MAERRTPSARAVSAEAYSQGRSERNVRTLARMISLAENDPHEAYRVLADAPAAKPARAHVIGITGPPGVGKSTLVDRIIEQFRSRDETVAVLAVDPSSPFAGGALLGDRVRMNRHASDPGVYIRSMATRGVLGGLSRAAWLGVRILTDWGFDWIMVETAGVGQSEIDIVDLAETTVLVLSPALGDDVQVMKAGIMEVADLFVVNKADLAGAERVQNSLTSLLEEHREHAREVWPTTANIADDTNGVPELAAALATRARTIAETDKLTEFRQRRTRIEIRRAALDLLGEMVDRGLEARGPTTPDPRHEDPMQVAEQIVNELVRAAGTDEGGRYESGGEG